MKTADFDQARLREWMAQALDGRIDDADRRALNETLAASAGARRYYREMMELHARLHLEYTGGREPEHMPDADKLRRRPVPRPTRVPIWLTAAAAAMLTLVVVRFLPGEEPATPAPAFATLQQSHSAQWGASDLPTRDGARLGHGNLKLKQGLAVIRFDSGAEISLEAPVELRLLDAMNCHITDGTAVANVPESASGFRIGTPSAMIIDHGTRFSVSVDAETGDTLTQVFDGLVDVENPATGEVVPLRAGQHNAVQGRKTGPVTDGFKERFDNRIPKTTVPSPAWTLLQTTQDAYIGFPLETDSEVLLYIKHGESGFHRKTYLEFDLAEVDRDRIESAELMLEFAPTGLGLASHVPDATFAVYGLIENNVAWDEKKLHPSKAPANLVGTGGLLAEEVTKLGTFVVPQGVQRGQFGIAGTSLADYLRQNAGSAVTLIVVRETVEIASTGLVHGIASRRHPTLPAPTLALQISTD